jgi:hypothetical protein
MTPILPRSVAVYSDEEPSTPPHEGDASDTSPRPTERHVERPSGSVSSSDSAASNINFRWPLPHVRDAEYETPGNEAGQYLQQLSPSERNTLAEMQLSQSSNESEGSQSPLLAIPRLYAPSPADVDDRRRGRRAPPNSPQLALEDNENLTFQDIVTAISPIYVTPFQLQVPDTPRYPIFALGWERKQSTSLEYIEAMRRTDMPTTVSLQIEEVYDVRYAF